ncbi:aromatic amino acid transport family protein [Brenneria sp. L3_3C_1]|nr:aromatic amino acid transport family protein [Brenneria sp. L3-3C-1]MEE3645422.1 aromatic amino acid transport family protein [Brenneria sp. L3_3C_1]
MSASIGLCDYLEDMLKNRFNRASRPLAILLTYFPPAVICIFMPEGFLPAMAFAGVSLVSWSVLLPPFLLLKVRKSTLKAVYTFPGNNQVLMLILSVGFLVWLMMFFYLLNDVLR